MPELPEVETMRRGILSSVNHRVVDVEQPKSRYRPILIRPSFPELKRRLVGRCITDVRRLGKRVIVDFDSGDLLVLQPKMAGLITTGDVPSEAHSRMIVRLEGESIHQFVYWDRRGLGTIQLWTRSELESLLNSSVLGPDALEISFDDFFNRFRNVRREVKPALLDQHRVAGVGNLYASEILHAAKVHPGRRCDQIRKDQWQSIYEKMRQILSEAILHEGSTLSDGTYRNSLNQSGGYQSSHRVYDRASLVCLTCANAMIVRIVQAQRSSFYCPVCQRKPRLSQ